MFRLAPLGADHPAAGSALPDASGFRGDARFAIVEAFSASTAASAAASPGDGRAFDDEPLPLDRHAQGWHEGYAAGFAEAHAEAARQHAAEAEAHQTIRQCVTRIDEAIEAQLRERLRETVRALCEATLAPLALDADALARRVTRAAAMLVRAEDERVVRLHPDDTALVADRFGDTLTIRPDASLARGAVRVEGASGGIEDGPEQWHAAIVTALDGAFAAC